jgi:hypothetical protein
VTHDEDSREGDLLQSESTPGRTSKDDADMGGLLGRIETGPPETIAQVGLTENFYTGGGSKLDAHGGSIFNAD